MKSSTVFIRSLAISSVALGVARLVAEPANPLFVPVTASVVAEVGDSPGAAWGDLDNDGWPDLVVSRSQGAPRVYRNLGDGQLALVAGALPEAGGDGHGVSLGDFDNDGRLDVLLAKRNGRPTLVYRNSGNFAFELLGPTVVPAFAGDAVGAAWGDYNRDGHLDAFLTDLSGVNRLWRNEGGASLAQLEGGAVKEATTGVGCAWADYDNDGDLDIFVANGGNLNNALYQVGSFVFGRVTTGDIVNNRGYSVSAAWGDYDNDGDLDLYVANRLGPNFLYRNEGRGLFTRITTGAIVTDASDSNGCTWADYDNDGDLDLFVASFNQSAVFLYRNLGGGVFERVLDEPPALPGGNGNSVVLADYDGDGFLDLFVSKWGGGNDQLYRNRGNGNRWFKIRVAQKAGEPSPNGLRARLKTRTDSGESWQMRELVAFDGWGGTDSTLHFGLGTASTVDVLVVTWPSGATREYRNLPANTTMTLSGTPEYLSVHPAPGFFTGLVTVTLTSRVAGGEVRYTLDGTEPTLSSPRYEEPLVLMSSTRLKARVFEDGTPSREIFSALYLENHWNDGIPAAWRAQYFGENWFTRPEALALADADNDQATTYQEWIAETNPVDGASKPAAPVALVTLNPPGGEFELRVDVWLSTVVPRGEVHYTTDGTEPTMASPWASGTPVLLGRSATLRARVFVNGNPVSGVVTGNYVVREVPPAITSQPADQYVAAGGTALFRVGGRGSVPFAFQWMLDGAEIVGATGPVLYLAKVTAADAGAYSVRVSNVAGSVVSRAAQLTVSPRPERPAIVTQPQSLEVVFGQPATFSVAVTGTDPLTFFWYRNGQRIGLAPSAPSFTIPSVKLTDAGEYWVRVANRVGSADSAVARLTVAGAPELPVITRAPEGGIALVGGDRTFTVEAAGTPPLSYQWFFNGAPLPGASEPTLALTGLTVAQGGTYTVRVANAGGAATASAVLEVVPEGRAGSVHFANRTEGVDAPVYDTDGVTKLEGPAFLAQLYAGPTLDGLRPAGAAAPFRSGPAAGYWLSGARSVGEVAPGGEAVCVVKVWEAVFGTTFEQAAAAGGKVGMSAPVTVITGGAGEPPGLPAPLIGLSSFRVRAELVPPVIAIVSPAFGTTADERVVLAGRVTDNVAVAAAAWEWNGQAMGPLALVEGRFNITGIRLLAGENRLKVTARDASGNTTAEEMVVTWQPLRVFGLGEAGATQEGRRFDVPVILNSGGDVAGLSFEVRYDPEWLRDPAVTFTDVLGGGLAEVNTDTPGTVRVTLSRAGTGIAAGEQVLANLSFRARSVPEPTRTELGLVLLDHADERGTPILFGTAVMPGAVTIQPRRFTGDNNGNDRLDIGDATVIQRFVASLEPVRPWDVLANDLNESRSLDSGDVVRVLRAVVGLDPQPRPAGGGALGRGAIQPSGAGGEIHGAPPVAPVLSGPAAHLVSEAPRAMPGERITVRVELAGLGQSISGVSFRIEFPAQALRLVEGGVRAGPMVPAGALGVWLADEGSVNVAFSALQAWSAASSRVAEFVFEVLPGAAAQREWTLVLGGAEVTSPDGYTVRPLAGSTLVVGALPVFGPTIGFEPDGRFQVAFSGRAGTRYVIEASADLRSWTPLDTVHCTGELMRWADNAASAERVRFYRLRQAP